jgi:hypothetical protein
MFLMPAKRNERKNIQRFNCPYCDRRLWRLGSLKHFFFYLEALEGEQNINSSPKTKVLLATKGAYIDNNSWREEFC